MRVLTEEQLLPAFINRFSGGRYINEQDSCGDV
jgi:hypothetical protein